MTTRRDLDRSIAAWLVAEAPGRAPDDVLEASRARLRTTRQRRLWMPVWRSNRMNIYTKLLATAAAVLVVAVVGYQLLPGRTSVGTPRTAPSPSPSPATPTASPTDTPLTPAGPLEPGRYAWAGPDGRLTFEVPAGWTGDPSGLLGGGISKAADQPGELALWTWAFDDYKVTHVYSDACLPPDTMREVGGTTTDLITGLEAQGSIDIEVSDLTLAGVPAKRIDLTEPDGLDRATCRHGAEGPLQIWADAIVNNYFALAPGTRGIAWVLDFDRGPLILVASYKEDASPAGLAELDAIVASMQVE
jgi:hypothetical protein